MAISAITSFTATTTPSEKIGRAGNIALLCLAGISLLPLKNENRSMESMITVPFFGAVWVCILKKVIAFLIGYSLFPKTSMSNEDLLKVEEAAFQRLQNHGVVTQKVTLKKSGISYDATLLYYPATSESGMWALYVLPGNIPMELCLEKISTKMRLLGVNTLLLNGPGVGRSGGFQMRYQMGAGFEAGLQFLEDKIKAKKILFQGDALGGAILAEAVLLHQQFHPEIEYLGIFYNTFSAFSKIVPTMSSLLTGEFCRLMGVELDTVAGVQKLAQMRIDHIIFQKNKRQDPVLLASAVPAAAVRTFVEEESQIERRIQKFFLGNLYQI